MSRTPGLGRYDPPPTLTRLPPVHSRRSFRIAQGDTTQMSIYSTECCYVSDGELVRERSSLLILSLAYGLTAATSFGRRSRCLRSRLQRPRERFGRRGLCLLRLQWMMLRYQPPRGTPFFAAPNGAGGPTAPGPVCGVVTVAEMNNVNCV